MGSMSRSDGTIPQSPTRAAGFASPDGVNHPPQSPTNRFYGSNGASPISDAATGPISPGSEFSQGKPYGQTYEQPSGSPHRLRGAARRNSGTKRICAKCGGTLTGQFVRALDNTYHLECFTCHVSILVPPRVLLKLTSILGMWKNRGLEILPCS